MAISSGCVVRIPWEARRDEMRRWSSASIDVRRDEAAVLNAPRLSRAVVDDGLGIGCLKEDARESGALRIVTSAGEAGALWPCQRFDSDGSRRLRRCVRLWTDTSPERLRFCSGSPTMGPSAKKSSPGSHSMGLVVAAEIRRCSQNAVSPG